MSPNPKGKGARLQNVMFERFDSARRLHFYASEALVHEQRSFKPSKWAGYPTEAPIYARKATADGHRSLKPNTRMGSTPIARTILHIK